MVAGGVANGVAMGSGVGVVMAGLWAALPLFVWPTSAPYALALAPPVIAAIAVQVATPWIPPAVTRNAPVRAVPVRRRSMARV